MLENWQIGLNILGDMAVMTLSDGYQILGVSGLYIPLLNRKF